MADDATLMDVSRAYAPDLSDADVAASQAEVERFVRWCGADRLFRELRGHEVANYAETLTGGVADAFERGEAVRRFLAYAKKAGYASTNLGTHLRLRKPSAARAKKALRHEQIEVSAKEIEAMGVELEQLKAQRPEIVADLKRAMEDKDFRENAPLDAARDRQGYVEGRIRTLEATLDRAVVVDTPSRTPDGAIDVGATVSLRNLQSGVETTYTLVRPSEVDAGKGRISFESPVGRSVIGHTVGDEVDVNTPSGALRFRIERVGD